MQGLNSNSEARQDQFSIVKNEVLKCRKILFQPIGETVQINKLEYIKESFEKPNNGGPFHDEIFKLEKHITTTYTKDLDGCYRSGLVKQGMCTIINPVCKPIPKLADGSTKGSGINNYLNKSESKIVKNLNSRKRVGNIVSTSRSGHLIEKKDDNCEEVLTEARLAENCDSNDNIITSEIFQSEMHDINDNPSDSKKEENENLSDNTPSEKSDSEAPCGIGLLERLIRSHPVWFLPGIQRAGAVHLLQGKEEGNFIVRQSSQPDTMAVSVRLPVGKGPYIEHYLIQSNEGQLSLESSENVFESIPSLIAHYCQCCDELPVQLTLPRIIREAKNRQQLSSLALLGQEFWRYPMANPRPPESQYFSPNSSKSDSFGSFDSGKKSSKQNLEIILDLVPLYKNSQPLSLLSTFKSSPTEANPPSLPLPENKKPKRPQTLDLISTSSDKTGLGFGNKTPPQPPPRWTKIMQNSEEKNSFNPRSGIIKPSMASPVEDELTKRDPKDCSFLLSSTPEYDPNMSSPRSDQTNLKSFGFERDKNSLRHFQEEKRPHLISPVSDTVSFISKKAEKNQKSQQFDSIQTEKIERMLKNCKKELKQKRSAHYQECDIVESPTSYYYKSNVADKQSDYEDIWVAESFTTFKPINIPPSEQENNKSEEKPEPKKPPDLLEKLEKSSKMSAMEKRNDKKVFQEESQNNEHNTDIQNLEQNDPKQNSPFYAEPADALVVRRKGRLSFKKSRHSDPFSINNGLPSPNPYFSGGNVLDRIDSQNEIHDDFSLKAKPSLSFDNIINLKKKEVESRPKINSKAKNPVKAKPVRPPKVGAPEKNHQYWAVDSSWEFFGNEETEKEGERAFPTIEQQMDSCEAANKYTVHEIITKRFPQFKISRNFMGKNNGNKDQFVHQIPFQKLESNKSISRISAYDNLNCDRPNFSKTGNDFDKNSELNCDNLTSHYDHHKISSGEPYLTKAQLNSETMRSRKKADCGSVTEDNDDTLTIFSEPWDSSRWENLLPLGNDNSEESFLGSSVQSETTLNAENSDCMSEAARDSERASQKLIKELYDMAPVLPSMGLKNKELGVTGASIRSYALHLASDKSTTFAQNIDNFIECTLESKETNPQIVMRNMRQFMSGMKNYLVKHGEREFEKQVEKERMKLKSTEFLNLDAILEGVMHRLVVRPLREHLYKLFVDEYIKNGAIQLLYENLCYARTKPLRDFRLKSKIIPPSSEALETICRIIIKLQEVDSPLEKLDHLLLCVSTIIQSVKVSNKEKAGIALGADDILPLFVWILVQSGFIAAEIEAEYMWGLLQPSLLSGEGCYYLTTLSSAVHVLKNLKAFDLDQSNRLTSNEWRCGDLKSVLKIIVPDELHGSILTKTLPVKPNMTTKDVCKIIAHKIHITNPQDYGLFRLVDGEETLLNDSECPQEVKSQFLESGKHCTLAYKRIDAKIGWPRTT